MKSTANFLFALVLLALLPALTSAQQIHLIDADWSFYINSRLGSMDLDQDGDSDVYATVPYGNQVHTWLNNGWGEFTNQNLVVTGYEYHQQDVVDMDGDHDLDLVLGDYTDYNGVTLIWVELQNGNQTVHEVQSVPPEFLPGYRGVAAGDVDQDGDQDIVAAFVYLQQNIDVMWTSIILYENNGSFEFTPTIAFQVNSYYLTGDVFANPQFVDVDNDGYLDIGFVRFTQHVVLHNDGTNQFTPIPIYSNFGFCDYQVWEDFDLDGDMDCLGYGSNEYIYLQNNSDDVIHFDGYPLDLTPVQFGQYGSVNSTDYNLDGYPDLSIYFDHGTPFLIHGIFDGVDSFDLQYLPTNGYGLAAADLDHDGDVDDITILNGQGLVWIENEMFSPANIRVRLIPQHAPVVLSTDGGPISMLASVNNMTDDPQSLRAWLVYTMPDGNEVVARSRQLTVNAGLVEHYPIAPTIPAGQDPGLYQATVRIGTYPNAVDEYTFPFWIE